MRAGPGCGAGRAARQVALLFSLSITALLFAFISAEKERERGRGSLGKRRAYRPGLCCREQICSEEVGACVLSCSRRRSCVWLLGDEKCEPAPSLENSGPIPKPPWACCDTLARPDQSLCLSYKKTSPDLLLPFVLVPTATSQPIPQLSLALGRQANT